MATTEDQRLSPPSVTGGTAELGSPAAAAEGISSPILDAEIGAPTRVSSPLRDAWRRFRHNWAAMISLGVILIIVIMAVFAPFMHTSNPLNPNYLYLNGAPNGSNWFGTDGLGRDIYSRIVYGLRPPLLVGLIGTAITVIVGTGIGITAGYFGGVIDNLLSRFTDLIFAFPAFLLAILVVSLYGSVLDPVFGGAGRVILLTIVFAGVSWPPLTRFVRSLALGLREQQFVEAARTSGSSSFKIIWRHLLPNIYGLLLVQASLITVGIIYNETTLSIFGLGVAPPNPDLGQMVYDGASQLGTGVQAGIFAETIFPAVFLAVMLLAFSFIGDGVRDAF